MKITDDYKKRVLIMLLSIVGMGYGVSVLLAVNYGSDPCSFMNSSLSKKFGITFGTLSLITNTVFFIPEILFGRKLIGPGTIANMVLVGYFADFFTFIWNKFLPQFIFIEQPYRTIVFVLALIPFLVFVAIYTHADAGLAPYDSIPMITHKRTKIPYIAVRITWDFLCMGIGILAGKHLTPATIILALTIGPAVSLIGKLFFHKAN